MRILRLRVPAFGPLVDLDTGAEPLPELVVVVGENEAGKSSLVEAIRSLLHGLYPAARDRHPLAPWSGAEGEIEGWVRGREGTTWRIHRRLLSSPWGRLEVVGEPGEDNLGNASIPPALHVDRDTYRQVHTVTLPELLRLDQAPAWTGLRDRILAGMASEELAPPRVVAESLEREAGGLWRARRARGSRDHALGEQIAEASNTLRVARERERALREARAEVERMREERQGLRQRLAQLQARLTETRELAPIRARLERLDALLVRAGDPALLAGLPTSPLERLQDLEEAEAEARRRLGEARAARLAAEADPVSPGAPEADDGGQEAPSLEDARWAEVEAEVRLLRDEAGGARETADRVRERQEECAEALAALAAAARPLLEGVDEDAAIPGGMGDGLDVRIDALARLPLEALREALLRRDQARRALDQAEARRETRTTPPASAPPPPRPGSTLPLLGGMALLVALAALAFLFLGRGTPGTTALALAGAIALGLVTAWVHRQDREREARHAERRDAEARERAEAEEVVVAARAHASRAAGQVAALVGELPLRPEVLAGSGEALASSLERLGDRLAELRRRRAVLHRDETRLGAQLQALRARVTGHPLLSVADPELARDPADLALEGWLELGHRWVARSGSWVTRAGEARAREARRREARERRTRAAEAEKAAAEGLEATRAAREAFLASLPPGVPGGTEVAGDGAGGAVATPGGGTGEASAPVGTPEPSVLAREAEARLVAWREAETVQADLENAHGPLEGLRARVRKAEGWPETTPEGRAAAEEEERQLREAIEDADGHFHRADALLASAGDHPAPDQVESEIAALRAERQELRLERDRLTLLARIAGFAEQRFREAHQPELIRRAETTLGHLTRGRYDTLVLGTPADPGALQVRGSRTPGSLPVEAPLSTGTREQIWFSLRLAVVGMAEGGGEPLPLVLDEVFVNWDAARRGAALDALASGAEERQVFLVTCHPFLAREAEARGARVVTLPPPSPGEAP